MLTNSISAVAPRARLAHTHILGSRTLVAAGSAAVVLRQRLTQQQTRGFRFGWWADHIDHDQRREMRRRYKAMRHQCSDAVNRKMQWDQQHANHAEAAQAYRRFAHHYWQPKRSFAFSRYRFCKDDYHKSRPSSNGESETAGSRPGRNIEDVERNAWSHFLFRDGDRTQPTWQSSFDDIRSYIAKRQEDILNEMPFASMYGKPSSQPKAASSAASGKKATASTEQSDAEVDYVIDPITNRKVSKSSAKSTPDEIANPPTPGYAMYDADLPPTQAELRAYKNVPLNDDHLDKSTMGGATVADSINSKDQSAEAQQQAKYDDLEKYKPIEYNEPDGKSAEAPAEVGHEGYDPAEVQKYKPFKYNEPDGQPVDKTVELGHEGYDPEELAKYKPFHYNEPDGKPTTSTAELGHAGYDPSEVQQYQPFMWNEPHGKPENESVELGHDGYDSAEVQSYQPFGYHEPHGQPPKAREEKGHHGYDASEVQQYKAFRHNEPDGKAPETVEDATDASELGSYGAVRYQEPDGKPAAVHDSSSDGLQEYDLKQASAEASEEDYAKVLRKLHSLTSLDGEGSAPGGWSGGSGSSSSSAPGKQSARPSREALESSMSRINAEHDAIDKLASISVKAAKSRARKQMTDAERRQANIDPYSTKPQGLETAYAEECGGEGTAPLFVKTHKRTDRPATKAPVPESAPSAPAEPSVYKILAYNPGMNTIDMAETSSAVPESAKPMSTSEVLLRLSNPAKFFPHFAPLRAQGFEIVSGSGDVLIFRKVREGQNLTSIGNSNGNGNGNGNSASRVSLPPSTTVNPIDMMGKKRYVPPSTANFVSPTGYVNLDLPPLHENDQTARSDLPLPPTASVSSAASASSTSSTTSSTSPISLTYTSGTMAIPTAAGAAQTVAASTTASTPEPFRSGIDVRREEPVFSGSKAGATADREKPGVAKRMVVGATWVAGVSYAIGLASEYVKGH
ncbi:MAG: hypothetical protein STHCBS139747_005499 [Sporothrix thermara]